MVEATALENVALEAVAEEAVEFVVEEVAVVALKAEEDHASAEAYPWEAA